MTSTTRTPTLKTQSSAETMTRTRRSCCQTCLRRVEGIVKEEIMARFHDCGRLVTLRGDSRSARYRVLRVVARPLVLEVTSSVSIMLAPYTHTEFNECSSDKSRSSFSSWVSASTMHAHNPPCNLSLPCLSSRNTGNNSLNYDWTLGLPLCGTKEPQYMSLLSPSGQVKILKEISQHCSECIHSTLGY
jgi:hypothetical protein